MNEESGLRSLCTVLLGIGLTWFWYYRRYICERPLVVSSWPLRRFLESHCPVVTERFCPTFWCPGGRLQTVVRVLMVSRPHVPYRNEIISTEDGGQLSLDWSDNMDSPQFPEPSTRPTVLFLPGLTGNSRQSYILHLVRQANRDGYRSLVCNNRGFGGEKLLTHKTFCAANTDDFSRVIQHVCSLFPQSPLLAVGVSLGGMLLVNYLAVTGDRSRLQAALVMSTPWDVFLSSESLEQPLNYCLFNRSLIATIRKTVQRFRDVIGKVLDVQHVLQSRSIREFDERYTSVVFGYQSCNDYYQQASPCHKLGSIHTPLLCINAEDDPFSPMEGIPLDRAPLNPHVALLIVARGGHIGFLEGFFPNHQSYMDRVFQQFIGASLRHCDQLRAATYKTSM